MPNQFEWVVTSLSLIVFGPPEPTRNKLFMYVRLSYIFGTSFYSVFFIADFLGFHKISRTLVLSSTLDISTPSMTLTTCLALCAAQTVPTHVAVTLDNRCICAKGSRALNAKVNDVRNIEKSFFRLQTLKWTMWTSLSIVSNQAGLLFYFQWASFWSI